MANATSLYDLWLALYLRQRLIFGVTLLSVLAAVGLSHWLPPVYEAKTSFYLALAASPAYSTALGASSLPRTPFLPQADEKSAGVHLGLVASKDMARRVHARFPGRSVDQILKNVSRLRAPPVWA